MHARWQFQLRGHNGLPDSSPFPSIAPAPSSMEQTQTPRCAAFEDCASSPTHQNWEMRGFGCGPTCACACERMVQALEIFIYRRSVREDERTSCGASLNKFIFSQSCCNRGTWYRWPGFGFENTSILFCPSQHSSRLPQIVVSVKTEGAERLARLTWANSETTRAEWILCC